MQAADPKVNGLDQGERDLLPERYRVVVVLPDEQHRDEAERILKEAGGDLG